VRLLAQDEELLGCELLFSTGLGFQNRKLAGLPV
jgi:hypothetical protein